MKRGSFGSSCISLSVFLAAYLCVAGARSSPRFPRNTQNSEYVTVSTPSGPVRGRKFDLDQGRELQVYLGIPYAKAPTGDLRFARPEPIEPWTEPRDALKHGNRCVERPIPGYPAFPEVPFGEDCLVVDIYTTGSVESPQPTMMFIHGGGYHGGSGALYNFTNLALKNVTVVTIGYRLDVFGFLSTLDDVIPGNFGLLDQALALKWIKSNIGAFGGDPRDITLFGGSAGASSVSILSMSPLTRGTFQKAILHSGAASCPWAVHSTHPKAVLNSRTQAALLSNSLGCNVTDNDKFSSELLTCLRSLDAQTIINASIGLQLKVYGGLLIWLPVVESVFGMLPDTPQNLLQKQDELVPVPTIYGYMKEDSSTFVNDYEDDGVTMDEFKKRMPALLTIFFPGVDREALVNDLIKAYMPKAESMTPKEIRKAFIDVLTDGSILAPMVHEARSFDKAGDGKDSKSYLFEFAHRPSYVDIPAWMGVEHSAENGFVLGLPAGPDPFKYTDYNASDETVADYVTTMWSNFAKTGNPTPEPVGMVEWPTFGGAGNDASEKVLVIQEHMEARDFNRANKIAVWTKYLFPEDQGGKGGGNGAGNSLTGCFNVICMMICLFAALVFGKC